MTIAMDGPAGAGKSTVAKQVASRLGIHYVDTGAMYRAIAFGILEQQEKDPEQAVADMTVTVQYEADGQHVAVNGRDVTGLIRTPEVSQAASRYAALPYVREKLTGLQRQIASDWEVVMDGRDIGTVVLPDAELKIYITASASERARRRGLEMEEKGMGPVDLKEIEREIIERDTRDMNREVAPLKQAEDAVLVDTTDMTIDQVVETICSLAQGKA